MNNYLEDKVVIAVSSRALFDLDDSDEIFRTKGLDEFEKYQIKHEDDLLKKGYAFNLIKKISDIKYKNSEKAFEVILLSRNNANTGLRVFNSIQKYGIDITRAAFTCGTSPYKYLSSFNAALFLSYDENDVEEALENGHAAARIMKGVKFLEGEENLRIAFDGDSVIFSDEAEKVFQENGLEKFKETENKKADIPLSPGPFKKFLEGLNRIKKEIGEDKETIRISLVTARNAPSHKRAIKTLRSWGISVDEAFFLGGLDKVSVLRQLKPHIYFDDSISYCLGASDEILTGHVINGIKNRGKKR